MLSSRLQIGHCPNYKLDPLENSLRATASATWPTVSAQQEEVHIYASDYTSTQEMEEANSADRRYICLIYDD